MTSGRRKMLAAREDLADKISEIATNKGFTLFSMINHLIELAISAEAMGTSLDGAVDNYSLIREVKNASFTLLPESLLYDTAELAYKKAKEKTLKTWFEAGVWIGKQYITRGIEDPLTAIHRDLKAFCWNIPELAMEKLEKSVSVRVLSPRFTESYTLLFNSFLEGVLEAFDYGITYKEVGKGNIRLEAAKRGANGQR